MSTPELVLSRGTNVCGLSIGRAQRNSALKHDRTASIAIRGHAFIQNLRRGHYELGMDARPGMTVAAAFDELALMV